MPSPQELRRAPRPRTRGRARAPITPAARYARRRRPVVLLVTGLACSIAALVLLAYVVGHGTRLGLGGFVESVLAAVTGPAAAIVTALVLAAFAAWCSRRLWFEWLAWRPGQVLVPVFSEGSDLDGANPVHLTALFRQRFASLQLQSPAPVPGAAPEGGFLEVLGQGALDARNPLGSLLTLLRAAKPTHAYVVHGVLVKRQAQPAYGVTVQVIRRPDEGAPPATVYDISWERAIRRAADRAMAHILPRTRRCAAPWSSWRGFVMPPALLEAYEAAVDFEAQRRYDQALAWYYDALERDPMNLSLRLHVGHLQEKLGLFIDALATYEGLIKVAVDEDEPAAEIYQPAARRERARALLLARYRGVVLLGGPQLGEQWRHTSSPEAWTERDSQRLDLRARMRGHLARRLRDTVDRHGLMGVHGADPVPLEVLLAEPEAPVRPKDDPMLHQLRRILVLHALDALPELQEQLRRLPLPPRDPRFALTRISLRLTELCMTERCRWIEQQLTRSRPWIWAPRDVDRLLEAVREAAGPDRMLRWHEHYNAACLLALPLLVPEKDAPGEKAARIRDDLAGHAVRHLERATACADSGYIATRRDWLLSEDPDLDGLRVHPRFKAFEAMYFPAAAPTPRRPRYVQRLEVSRYTRDLIDATARRWQHEWHRRRLEDDLTTPARLVEWWQDERDAWSLVGRVAWNHRRWRARFDLLAAMDELSLKYGGAPLEVAFRTFEEPWMCAQPERRVDALAELHLGRATRGLQDLARRLSGGRPQDGAFTLPGVDAWIDRLRELDADGAAARAEDVVRLCDRHAAAWERLRLWVGEADAAGDDPAAERFADQLRRLERQLRAAA